MGLKLVFMGTATFAVPSLSALFQAGYTISGVITQPDKAGGRGRLLQSPPVKRRAYELQLPVYQPDSFKSPDARQLMEAFAPDLIVVVAYGKILPAWVLHYPKLGCINLHGSLLPKYRGAAPVQWAIAEGEETTGVCTMRLDEGVDTGPVYLCEETAIRPDETAPELYDRLAFMGAPLLVKTIEGIAEGRLEPKPQDNSQATYAPVLKKADGFINWLRPSREIHNRVRAFNPWPGTVSRFRGKVCKILKTALPAGDGPIEPEPGSVTVSKNGLLVTCGDGMALEILLIQPENRKAVSGLDFANGARIRTGEKFQPVLDNS